MERVRLVEQEIKVEDRSGGRKSSETGRKEHVIIDLIKGSEGGTGAQLERAVEKPKSHVSIDLIKRPEGDREFKETGAQLERFLEKPKSHVSIDLIKRPEGERKLKLESMDLIKISEGDREFKLERILEEPGSHQFYCPNCKACIENINVRREEQEPPIPFPCISCSSFLVVIGNGLISICNPPRQPGDERPADMEDPHDEPLVPPQGLGMLPTPVNNNQPNGVPAKKWDILKSIVYGGLLESITSLNVVTSAAGADATALNILALGLANLIGGLFVIGHNLMEFRNDQSEGSGTGQTSEETSRYYQELGLRENFKRHAIVTLLSFLLFGLVAPVTYSFSFLKSGNKDLKLIAVAIASLMCITVLAIGKAYIQKASGFYRYIKTILSFVIPGFMASGLSYVVGDLIKKLLEKLGLFESSTTFTLSLPKTTTTESEWGFY